MRRTRMLQALEEIRLALSRWGQRRTQGAVREHGTMISDTFDLLIFTPSNFLAATTSAVSTWMALCTVAKPPRPMIWPICCVGGDT